DLYINSYPLREKGCAAVSDGSAGSYAKMLTLYSRGRAKVSGAYPALSAAGCAVTIDARSEVTRRRLQLYCDAEQSPQRAGRVSPRQKMCAALSSSGDYLLNERQVVNLSMPVKLAEALSGWRPNTCVK